MAIGHGENWTAEEVSVVVADYLLMLRLHFAGQKFNRSEQCRQVQKLVSRSKAAIEFKRRNISAVLQELGMPWLLGYLPAMNYQRPILMDIVVREINAQPGIDMAMLEDSERAAELPAGSDFSKALCSAPAVEPRTVRSGEDARIPRRFKRDYLAREARNASLGLAGEHYVLMFEEWRLRTLGCAHLAKKIEHTANDDDAAGYDVLSYEVDGRERFIEVKTTAYARETPFYVSQQEIEFSVSNESQYKLYRVFEFRVLPKLFEIGGALHKHCLLDPVSYRASFQ